MVFTSVLKFMFISKNKLEILNGELWVDLCRKDNAELSGSLISMKSGPLCMLQKRDAGEKVIFITHSVLAGENDAIYNCVLKNLHYNYRCYLLSIITKNLKIPLDHMPLRLKKEQTKPKQRTTTSGCSNVARTDEPTTIFEISKSANAKLLK